MTSPPSRTRPRRAEAWRWRACPWPAAPCRGSAIGFAHAIGAAANPERAEREAEDERGEHQLERVRRAPEHEREHADPRDLVDERRDSAVPNDTARSSVAGVGAVAAVDR